MKTSTVILALLSLATASSSYAQTQIESDVTLQESVTISDIGDLNFGSLSYQSLSQGGPISLEPNSSLNFGLTGYTSNNAHTPGSFKMTGIAGEIIVVSCTPNAVLAKSTDSNHTILLYDIIYELNGILSYCISSPVNFSSSAENQFYIGGKVNLPSATEGLIGGFSTSNAGGSPMSFTITYL
tara:strand:+ start:3587 stop:4135 length:549 start_codon:yes stop_codon:yes gene_type:complete